MKTAKEERRLQEADAEIGREFGQMTGILMDTLVRVSADLFEVGQIYGYRVERAALERGVARPVRPCNCAPCELQPGGCDKARR